MNRRRPSGGYAPGRIEHREAPPAADRITWNMAALEVLVDAELYRSLNRSTNPSHRKEQQQP